MRNRTLLMLSRPRFSWMPIVLLLLGLVVTLAVGQTKLTVTKVPDNSYGEGGTRETNADGSRIHSEIWRNKMGTEREVHWVTWEDGKPIKEFWAFSGNGESEDGNFLYIYGSKSFYADYRGTREEKVIATIGEVNQWIREIEDKYSKDGTVPEPWKKPVKKDPPLKPVPKPEPAKPPVQPLMRGMDPCLIGQWRSEYLELYDGEWRGSGVLLSIDGTGRMRWDYSQMKPTCPFDGDCSKNQIWYTGGASAQLSIIEGKISVLAPFNSSVDLRISHNGEVATAQRLSNGGPANLGFNTVYTCDAVALTIKGSVANENKLFKRQ